MSQLKRKITRQEVLAQDVGKKFRQKVLAGSFGKECVCVCVCVVIVARRRLEGNYGQATRDQTHVAKMHDAVWSCKISVRRFREFMQDLRENATKMWDANSKETGARQREQKKRVAKMHDAVRPCARWSVKSEHHWKINDPPIEWKHFTNLKRSCDFICTCSYELGNLTEFVKVRVDSCEQCRN